jgi:type IV pilus assembly protein PilM
MAGYLPVDSEKHAMDFKIIEEITENNATMYRIMVATIHKRILEHFSSILRGAGFSLKILDANENAQEKFIRSPVHRLLAENNGNGICVVDMGAETTKINLFHDGRFFAGYLLNRGGNKITQLVSQNMQTDAITAENFKLKSDLFYNGNINENLRIAVKNEIDSLLYEISKVADYFWSRTGKALGSILLCGGASGLGGLLKYFQSSVKVRVLDPYSLLNKYAGHKALTPSDYSVLLNCYAASFREEAK